ncbi:MAG: CGNR zinc finger domain-containing protein [Rubrobacteraceae bacterium]|nr:CGNR zinc finger domain-containing protein [Rubrobacteraceae bacterium]
MSFEHWKADEYRISEVQGVPSLLPRYEKKGAKTRCIEAAGDYRTLVNPFDYYRPSESGRREADAGPHLMFLRLKDISREKPHLLEKAIVLFAQRYGLLGLPGQEFLPEPVLQYGKRLIAPEAVVEGGTLHVWDPATKGIDFLRKLKQEGKLPDPFLNDLPEDLFLKYVALPKDLKLISPRRPQQSRKLVPWPELKKKYGAILAWRADRGFFALHTREPLREWKAALEAFPTPDDLLARSSVVLTGAHPLFETDEEGSLQPGWVCDSLLTAMHLMLFLDHSHGNRLIKCASRGCPNYFRTGPYSRARYCSQQCASRAATRLYRGQEP